MDTVFCESEEDPFATIGLYHVVSCSLLDSWRAG